MVKVFVSEGMLYGRITEPAEDGTGTKETFSIGTFYRSWEAKYQCPERELPPCRRSICVA